MCTDLAFKNNDHYIGAQYFLQITSPPVLCNWNEACAADDDTRTIIKPLLLHKPSTIQVSVYASVNKGYKEHIKKVHISIISDKIILYKTVNMGDNISG